MSYDVTLFGLHFTLNPVAFSIPLGSKSWDIYWYGIIIATGFLLALIYGMRNAKRFGIDPDRMIDVILVTTPVAILCARTYYVLFDGVKLESVGEFFGFGSASGSQFSGFAGIAIYGGVIGAFLCGALMCKLRKVNILDMFDLAVLGFLIGQGIGRWGNFVNQEAYGAYTGSSWWGMESNRTISEMGGAGMVHPCFLYESIWCIAGFFLLHKFSKKRKFKGETALMYGAWYGLGRAVIELLRTDSLKIGLIKVSCLLSVLICIASIIAIIVIRKKLSEDGNGLAYLSIIEDGGTPEVQPETPVTMETEESEIPETETQEDAEDVQDD